MDRSTAPYQLRKQLADTGSDGKAAAGQCRRQYLPLFRSRASLTLLARWPGILIFRGVCYWTARPLIKPSRFVQPVVCPMDATYQYRAMNALQIAWVGELLSPHWTALVSSGPVHSALTKMSRTWLEGYARWWTRSFIIASCWYLGPSKCQYGRPPTALQARTAETQKWSGPGGKQKWVIDSSSVVNSTLKAIGYLFLQKRKKESYWLQWRQCFSEQGLLLRLSYMLTEEEGRRKRLLKECFNNNTVCSV
jgi:hypothetical protein